MDDQTRRNLAIALGVASVGALGYFAYKRFSAPAHAAQIPGSGPAVLSADDPAIRERMAPARQAWMDQQIAERRMIEEEAARRGMSAYELDKLIREAEYRQMEEALTRQQRV